MFLCVRDWRTREAPDEWDGETSNLLDWCWLRTTLCSCSTVLPKIIKIIYIIYNIIQIIKIDVFFLVSDWNLLVIEFSRHKLRVSACFNLSCSSLLDFRAPKISFLQKNSGGAFGWWIHHGMSDQQAARNTNYSGSWWTGSCHGQESWRKRWWGTGFEDVDLDMLGLINTNKECLSAVHL